MRERKNVRKGERESFVSDIFHLKLDVKSFVSMHKIWLTEVFIDVVFVAGSGAAALVVVSFDIVDNSPKAKKQRFSNRLIHEPKVGNWRLYSEDG